jgi:hypothetical protein
MTPKHQFRNSPLRPRAWFVLALGAVALTQFARPSGSSQGNKELDNVVEKLSQSFPFADSTEHIYALNSVYVVQPLFDKSGVLTEIRIFPRYYFNETHPDWREPDNPPYLDEPEYRRLLSLIDKVSPLGQLKKKDSGSKYVSNDQYPATDEYENSIIDRSMRTGNGLPDTVVSPVVSIRIYFVHLVSGHLDSIAKSRLPHEFDIFCRVRIDGKVFWIPRKGCGSLRIGRQISAMAAGPADEM